MLRHFKTENEIYNNQTKTNKSVVNTLYVIPVVFHLITRPGSQSGNFYAGNPDDSTVISSFFAGLNQTYRNTGAFDQGVGADMEIEFCLASRDTNGNYTNGITRLESCLTDSCGYMTNLFYTDSIKKITCWNPEKYLNIWIVANMVDGSGFSTFPWAPRNYLDGVMININYLTTDYVAGVMLAHETGHYFGLYHVFQGGCINYDCLLNGDKVCDTPPSTQQNIVVSCSDNTFNTDMDDTSINNPFSTDVSDNIRTYMNYGLPFCINQFTEGQKSRARICLETYRTQLLASDGCTINSIDFEDKPVNRILGISNENNGEISVSFFYTGSLLIKIFDCRGICIYNKKVSANLNNNITIKDLKPGFYIIRAIIEGEMQKEEKKFVVF